MSHLFVVRLQGGIGNQMFQYAKALALSAERSTRVLLDVSSFDHDRIRRYSLDRFEGVRRRLAAGDRLSLLGPRGRTDQQLFWRLVSSGAMSVLVDDFRTFDVPQADVILDGYWQSERHFAKSVDDVARDFAVDGADDLARAWPGIGGAVALHVRRTDYLASGGFHPVLGLDYYEAALSRIGPGHVPYVFSDDVEWCEANMVGPLFRDAVFVRSGGEMDDLRLMSMAAHNVIANSTFSWWAAWLNRRPGRRVVAPSTWFGGHSTLDSSNIVPGGWEVI